MAKFAKEGDLSQDALGVDKIVECSRDLLYGDLLPVLGVEGGYHHAVCTDPYRLDQLVLRIKLQKIEERQQVCLCKSNTVRYIWIPSCRRILQTFFFF